jgi:hypothetical protein
VHVLDDVEDLGRAALVQIALRALARTLPDAPLDAFMARITPSHRRPCFGQVPRSVAATIRVVDAVVARTPVGPQTCLFRALARYAALRQARVDATFCMGVRADQPNIAAHAWVEVGGVAVFEVEAPRYLETFRWPRPTMLRTEASRPAR